MSQSFETFWSNDAQSETLMTFKASNLWSLERHRSCDTGVSTQAPKPLYHSPITNTVNMVSQFECVIVFHHVRETNPWQQVVSLRSNADSDVCRPWTAIVIQSADSLQPLLWNEWLRSHKMTHSSVSLILTHFVIIPWSVWAEPLV